MPTHDSANEDSPPAPPPAPTPAAGQSAPPTPPPAAPQPPLDTGRRSFFGQSLREVMTPLAFLWDKKVAPIINALEQLPVEVEKIVGPLDQPQGPPRHQPAAAIHSAAPTARGPLPDRYLRPPGALPPGEFETTCSRCGKCVEVCPAHAIKLDHSGLAGDGLPYIVPQDMPCVVCDSLACMNLCPSGALKLVAIAQIHMGLAKVNHATCRRSLEEDCRLCVEACPVADVAIAISPHTNRIQVKHQGCIGCGLCEHACPTQPRSIIVHPTETPTDPLIA